jgi:hypothetical protein
MRRMQAAAWGMRLGLAVVAVGVLSGCANHDVVRLVRPPSEPAADYPGGHRLLTRAPLGDWQVVAHFADRSACEQARQQAMEASIARAHAALGEGAKDDLDVRRAVNARCVRTDRMESDAP